MMITDTGFFSGINCPVSPFFDFGLLSDTSHNAVVGCCSTIIAVVEGVGGRGKGGGHSRNFSPLPAATAISTNHPQKIPMPSTAFHHPTDIKSEPNRENATTILDFDGGQPSQGVGHEPPTIEMGKFKSALPWKPSIQLQFQGSSQSIHGLPPLPRPLHAPTGNSQLISICN